MKPLFRTSKIVQILIICECYNNMKKKDISLAQFVISLEAFNFYLAINFIWNIANIANKVRQIYSAVSRDTVTN